MLSRGRGRDRLAGQQHFHRLLARNVARQRHHRRRAEQSDIDAGRGKARGFGRDGEIAACDQLAAGRGRDALDGGDHGLRQMHDRLHHGAAGVHDLREIGAAAIGVAAPRGQFLHVVAGGEGRAVGGDHHRTHALVVVDLLQRPLQFRDQAFGEAVARGRAVERQHGDAADRLAEQDRGLRRWGAGGLGHCQIFH